jgi:hypothetical protein
METFPVTDAADIRSTVRVLLGAGTAEETAVPAVQQASWSYHIGGDGSEV